MRQDNRSILESSCTKLSELVMYLSKNDTRQCTFNRMKAGLVHQACLPFIYQDTPLLVLESTLWAPQL